MTDLADKSEEAVRTAFSLDVGQVSDPLKTPEGMIILRVVEKLGIDEKKFQEEKETLRESLLQQKRNVIYRGFVDELRKKANIKVLVTI